MASEWLSAARWYHLVVKDPTCPNCGVALNYDEIMVTSPVFPCPACGTKLQVPVYFVMLTFYGSIVAPALIIWLLGSSWEVILVGGLLLAYPSCWLVLKYAKYVLRPRVEPYVDRDVLYKQKMARLRRDLPPRVPRNAPTELRLRDRKRP